MRGDISGEGEKTAIAIGEFLRARDKADVQMAERCCSLQIIRLRKQHDRLFFLYSSKIIQEKEKKTNEMGHAVVEETRSNGNEVVYTYL